MPQEPGQGVQRRIDIPYFEGVNNLVDFNVGKPTEFFHMENARSKTIGTIEKREGQTVLGLNQNNLPFVTTANYSIFSFQNDFNQGFYRISVPDTNGIISIDNSMGFGEDISLVEVVNINFVGSPPSPLLPLTIVVTDHIETEEQVNNGNGTLATIYYINGSNQWIPLTELGTNIPGGIFDYSYAEGQTYLVNGNAANRYIDIDATSVIDSSNATGNLFNTPTAYKVNYYKSRLYLADYVQSGVRYQTTILRSSYAMGIIALFNDDYPTAAPGTTIEVTDTTYFYTDSGANAYDVYRGPQLISTITVTLINQTSIVATWSGTPSFLSSDEIWISGTYFGRKIFRWVNNSSISGRDVKQYDTFKLSGGENDPINMLTNVGNIMIIANKSAITSWNDYTIENFDLDVGCVSKKGYVKMLGTLYFLHYTGVYATSGAVPQLISNKIEKYITGATKIGKESSAAGKKGRSIFFTLGAVTLYNLDGSINKVLQDVCVEYNITQENWFIHTNVKASEFATFIESSDADRLELADTSGNHAIKEFLNGESDDGDVIHFRIDTIKLTLQPANFEYSSKLVAILVETERGSSMQVFVNLQNKEEYYPVEGNIAKGISIIKFSDKDSFRGRPPVCRLVSVSIRDSSVQLCKVSRMSVIFLPSVEETRDNDI